MIHKRTRLWKESHNPSSDQLQIRIFQKLSSLKDLVTVFVYFLFKKNTGVTIVNILNNVKRLFWNLKLNERG